MPLANGKPRSALPPPTPTAKPWQRSAGWQTQTITLLCQQPNGWETKKKVEAQVYGGVAVHAGFDDSAGKYAVTVVSVGLRCCLLPTEADCYRVAEYLWDRYCLALRLKTKEAIMEKLSPAAVAWLTQCREQGRWLTPKGG